MKKVVIVLGSLLFLIFGFGSFMVAQASGFSNIETYSKVQNSSLIKVGYGFCHKKRHECADAWGRGTRDYYYCLREHGCRRYKRSYYKPHRDYSRRVCKSIYSRCGARYDYGTRGYHTCLKQYGCSDRRFERREDY